MGDRPVLAGPGPARRVPVRQGAACCGSHGAVCHGSVGLAWQGKARQARYGSARCGAAGFGKAGKARSGGARHGEIRCGKAGSAGHVLVGRGSTWLGRARQAHKEEPRTLNEFRVQLAQRMIADE